MKKILILTITFVFLLTTVSVDTYGQTKRKKKRGSKGLITNLAIIGGSTAAGALIGRGRNGAMIGAGAGLLYATSRKGTKRRYQNSKVRRYSKVAGGALLGAGTGAAVGGKTGLAIGAIAGGGATYLYTRNGRKYYKDRRGNRYTVKNGRRYYQ